MSFKLKLMTGTMALALVGSVALSTGAKAEGLWDPHLRGVAEGLAAGALPPPGVYGILDNYWADYSNYNGNGDKLQGEHLNALVEVPIVLYVPGVKVLGADYAAGIAQPFDYTSFEPTSQAATGAGNLGTFNTILIPAWLSWTLPANFHVLTGFEVYLPDASTSLKNLQEGHLTNGGLPSGMGFWALQPDLGISYLNGPWNLSAAMSISFPLSDDSWTSGTTSTNYRSGDEFSGDYTATYTMGKWAFGLGVHSQEQFTEDTANGADAHKEVHDFGMGPLVSYQLGTWNVLAEWNHNIATSDNVAGDLFNLRLLTAF
jgi:hypothetical protein